MPASKTTFSIVFKAHSESEQNLYHFLKTSPGSITEAIMAALTAAYGYQAIEQTEASPDQKVRALLKSNAELNKFMELNKALASLPSVLTGTSSSSPIHSSIPYQSSATVMDAPPPASPIAADPSHGKFVDDTEEEDDEDLDDEQAVLEFM
jgi:hypothetical protein